MELRRSSWNDVVMMPYQFFMDDLKWKIDLEEEKRKRLEEKQRSSGDKAYKALQKR